MLNLKDDLVESGLDTLLGQFADSEKMRGLLSALLEELREAESTVYDLFWARTLAGAKGAQLDVYGKVLDEPREGLADFEYRRFLNVRLLVLYAQGEAVRLRRIVGGRVFL